MTQLDDKSKKEINQVIAKLGLVCADFEKEGFDNMDITRGLVAFTSSVVYAWKDDTNIVEVFIEYLNHTLGDEHIILYKKKDQEE